MYEDIFLKIGGNNNVWGKNTFFLISYNFLFRGPKVFLIAERVIEA
jgi:hypothetical protein